MLQTILAFLATPGGQQIIKDIPGLLGLFGQLIHHHAQAAVAALPAPNATPAIR